jgi:hypothetical protein
MGASGASAQTAQFFPATIEEATKTRIPPSDPNSKQLDARTIICISRKLRNHTSAQTQAYSTQKQCMKEKKKKKKLEEEMDDAQALRNRK